MSWYSNRLIIARLEFITSEYKFMMITEDGHLPILSSWPFIIMLPTLLNTQLKIWRLCSTKPMNTNYRPSKIQKTCQCMWESPAILTAMILSLWKLMTHLSSRPFCGHMWENSMCCCVLLTLKIILPIHFS